MCPKQRPQIGATMGSQSPTPPPGINDGIAGTTPAPSSDDAVAAHKLPRRPSQVVALVLGILLLAIAALGVLTIAVSRAALAEMDLSQEHISGLQVLVVAIDIFALVALEFLGWVLVIHAVPGVASITLFARVTRLRLVVNSAIAAIWLALAVSFVASSFSLITFESWADFVNSIARALLPLVLPVVYVACIACCALGLLKRSGREGPRRPCGELPPPPSYWQSPDVGDEAS